MAASSSIVPGLEKKRYDVFINYRGVDTRSNFVSHLYKALTTKGILTFIDDALLRGKEISPFLLQAIEDSSMGITVFTQKYASSPWCLDELVKMTQCRSTHRQIIIPVFYGVDRSHVKELSGEFGNEFKRLIETVPDTDRVEKWKAALPEAASLSGWVSGTIGSDVKLIDEIVNDVLQKLNLETSGVTQGLIATESSRVLMEELENEEWLSLFASLVIEGLSALFEQLDHALLGMVMAIAGLLICMVELAFKAQKEQVNWERRGLLPWFYSYNPQNKLFGTTVEYFGLVAAIWQCFHSTIGYIYARQNMKNPITMTLTMSLFCICLLISKLVKKYSVVSPRQRDP
ncbi:disease resistance protein RPV1 [Ricinus communis]|uniref:disease resistance protein RPV1 n=1 Tax=Ricinus communis TaxID=3988 RepID=UPI00201B2753|nr:disease resistance protein RPV1 [Ricinus communis]